MSSSISSSSWEPPEKGVKGGEGGLGGGERVKGR